MKIICFILSKSQGLDSNYYSIIDWKYDVLPRVGENINAASIVHFIDDDVKAIFKNTLVKDAIKNVFESGFNNEVLNNNLLHFLTNNDNYTIKSIEWIRHNNEITPTLFIE